VQASFVPNALTALTAYDVYVVHRDAASNSSNVLTDEFTTTAVTDSTAPILSALTGDATSATAASYVVTTNEANGNLYWVAVLTSAPPPNANQILFGQDGSGAAAVDSGNQVVSTTGVQPAFTPNGLTGSTAYDVYVTHRDAASNNSNVVTDEFTTQVLVLDAPILELHEDSDTGALGDNITTDVTPKLKLTLIGYDYETNGKVYIEIDNVAANLDGIGYHLVTSGEAGGTDLSITGLGTLALGLRNLEAKYVNPLGVESTWSPVLALTVEAASTTDAATTAWKNAVVTAGGTVSPTLEGVINTMITTLKGGTNVWTRLDRLWFWAADEPKGSALDVVALQTATFPDAAGTPIYNHTPGEGIACLGLANTASFINTHYVPSVDGVNATTNSAMYLLYIRTSSTVAADEGDGCFDSATTRSWFFGPKVTYSTPSAGMGSAAIGVADTAYFANANHQGCYVISRTGAAASAIYKNGNSTPIHTTTIPTVGLPTVPFYVGTGHNTIGGDASNFGYHTKQESVLAIGAGLNAADAVTIMNAVNAAMTTLGKNIY
jgi:hypothetical protein